MLLQTHLQKTVPIGNHIFKDSQIMSSQHLWRIGGNYQSQLSRCAWQTRHSSVKIHIGNGGYNWCFCPSSDARRHAWNARGATLSRPYLGDGNCLHRTGSLLAYGTEDHREEVQVKIIVDQILHKEKYLDPDFLSRGIVCTQMHWQETPRNICCLLG